MEYLYKTTKKAYIKLRGGGNCIDTLKEQEIGFELMFYGKTVYDWLIDDINTYSNVSYKDKKRETYLENLTNYLITIDEKNESNLSKIKNFIRDGTEDKILLIDGMNLIRNDLFFISMLSVVFEGKTMIWNTYKNLGENKNTFQKRIILLKIFIRILSKYLSDTNIILFYHGSNINSQFEIDRYNKIGFAEISCYEKICETRSENECYKSENLKNEVDDYILKYVEQLFKILKGSESEQYKTKMKSKTLYILSGDRYAWMYKKDRATKQQNIKHKEIHDKFNFIPRVKIKFSLSEEKDDKEKTDKDISLPNKLYKTDITSIEKNDKDMSFPNKLSELYINDELLEINNEIFNHIYINKWDTNKIEYAKAKYKDDNDTYEDDIYNYKKYSEFLNNYNIDLSNVYIDLSKTT